MFIGTENGKYGAVNYEGKIVIPFIYDSLNPLDTEIDFNKNCIIGKLGTNYYKLNTLTGEALDLGNNVKKIYDDLYMVIDETNQKLEIISQEKTYITFGNFFPQYIDIDNISSTITNKVTMNPIFGEYIITRIETTTGQSHFIVNSTKELPHASTFETIKVGTSGLYQNGTRVLTWYELTEKYPDAFKENGKISPNKSAPGTYDDSFLSELSGELIIDKSITEIEDLAFLNCINLTNIKLPETLTTIGFNAFQYCVSLTSITIPSSVTTLKPNIFYGDSNIKEVIIDANLSSEMLENSGVLESATIVYIKHDLTITDFAYLEENFTIQTNSDKTTYNMYIRNS